MAHCSDPFCSPDNDADGIADVTDNCYRFTNPDQLDSDGDGLGNACDGDDDGDGVDDEVDAFPLDPTKSTDGDMTTTVGSTVPGLAPTLPTTGSFSIGVAVCALSMLTGGLALSVITRTRKRGVR